MNEIDYVCDNISHQVFYLKYLWNGKGAYPHDPLTAAVCSMQEIKNMLDKLFESQRQWLPQFKHNK